MKQSPTNALEECPLGNDRRPSKTRCGLLKTMTAVRCCCKEGKRDGPCALLRSRVPFTTIEEVGAKATYLTTVSHV